MQKYRNLSCWIAVVASLSLAIVQTFPRSICRLIPILRNGLSFEDFQYFLPVAEGSKGLTHQIWGPFLGMYDRSSQRIWIITRIQRSTFCRPKLLLILSPCAVCSTHTLLLLTPPPPSLQRERIEGRQDQTIHTERDSEAFQDDRKLSDGFWYWFIFFFKFLSIWLVFGTINAKSKRILPAPRVVDSDPVGSKSICALGSGSVNKFRLRIRVQFCYQLTNTYRSIKDVPYRIKQLPWCILITKFI